MPTVLAAVKLHTPEAVEMLLDAVLNPKLQYHEVPVQCGTHATATAGTESHGGHIVQQRPVLAHGLRILCF